MDLFEALRTTPAVRRFTAEPVSDEEIERCLEAATRAPSGGNVQPWQFLVVRDEEVKKRLAAIYSRAYDRYEPAMMKARPPARSGEDEARFRRMAGSARHLAEHLDDAQALVLFLMLRISMTVEDEEGPMDVGPPYASVYPAIWSFMLAARGLGIGTTLTTVIRAYEAEAREVCGVPDRFEIAALVPLGRPRGRFFTPVRRPLAKIVHRDRFGKRPGGD